MKRRREARSTVLESKKVRGRARLKKGREMFSVTVDRGWSQTTRKGTESKSKVAGAREQKTSIGILGNTRVPPQTQWAPLKGIRERLLLPDLRGPPWQRGETEGTISVK